MGQSFAAVKCNGAVWSLAGTKVPILEIARRRNLGDQICAGDQEKHKNNDYREVSGFDDLCCFVLFSVVSLQFL